MSKAFSAIWRAPLVWVSLTGAALAAAPQPTEIRIEPGTTVQIDVSQAQIEPDLKPRTGPDARHCLTLANYKAVVRCAEKYR